MDKRSIAIEWLHMAQQDLSSALFLLRMNPPPMEIICYHCQQCAEKSLKAYIASVGNPVQRTHDLTVLCKLCAGFDSRFLDLEEACVELTDYGTQIRYPFHVEINMNDTEQALAAAELILSTIRGILELP